MYLEFYYFFLSFSDKANPRLLWLDLNPQLNDFSQSTHYIENMEFPCSLCKLPIVSGQSHIVIYDVKGKRTSLTSSQEFHVFNIVCVLNLLRQHQIVRRFNFPRLRNSKPYIYLMGKKHLIKIFFFKQTLFHNC